MAFCHLQENLVINVIKTKTGIDAAKTAFKRVVQKTVEATGDLIGNKIAGKITSIEKEKQPKRKRTTNKVNEIYIPSE